MTGHTRALLTAACCFALMSYAFTVASWGPAADLIAAEFGVAELKLGMLRTALFIGFTASLFAGGLLMNRLGAKVVSVAGPFGLALGLAGFSLSRGYAPAFASMIVVGCSGGLLEVAVNTAVAEANTERRAFALNLLHVFFGIGAFIAPRATAWALAEGLSWRVVFGAIAVTAAAASVLFAALPQPPLAEKRAELRPADIARFSARPAVVLLGLAMVFYVGAEIGINDWIVLYFQRFLGMDKTAASGLLSNYWLLMTVGRLFCALAARRVSAEILLCVITGLSAVSTLLIFTTDNPAAAGAFLMAAGFITSGTFATIIAIGADRFPRDTAVVSGLLMGFSGIGNLAFPVMVGAIAQATDLRLGLAVSCGMLFFLFFVSLAILRMKRAGRPAAITQ